MTGQGDLPRNSKEREMETHSVGSPKEACWNCPSVNSTRAVSHTYIVSGVDDFEPLSKRTPAALCHQCCREGTCLAGETTGLLKKDSQDYSSFPKPVGCGVEDCCQLMGSSTDCGGGKEDPSGELTRAPSISSVGKKTDDNSLEEKPWQYKLIALLCTCFLAFGSHYAAHMLASLKSTLIKELGITNSQYGTLQGSASLVSTILPLLGGIFIDMFGTAYGSLVASTLIFVGDVIVALSTEFASFEVMIVGRVMYGLGAGCIVTVQETILAHWFHGKGLAVMVGIQIAMSKLAGFLATWTVVPIRDHTGFYGHAFWVSAALCGFSWLVNVVYVLVLRAVGVHTSFQELAKLKRKKSFKLGEVLRFPALFWVIAFASLIFGACWGPFLHIAMDLVKRRWGDSDILSALKSSTTMVLPAVISPFLGLMLDRFGRRTWIVFISAITLLGSFLLLGFTYVTPILGMVVFSISLTFGPVALISSIPLLLPLRSVGTALGFYKCATNIGSTIVDTAIGMIQDETPDHSYDGAMWFLTTLAIASVVCSIFFMFGDWKREGLLNAAVNRRTRILRERARKVRRADREKKRVDVPGSTEEQAPLMRSFGEPVLSPTVPAQSVVLEIEDAHLSTTKGRAQAKPKGRVVKKRKHHLKVCEGGVCVCGQMCRGENEGENEMGDGLITGDLEKGSVDIERGPLDVVEDEEVCVGEVCVCNRMCRDPNEKHSPLVSPHAVHKRRNVGELSSGVVNVGGAGGGGNVATESKEEEKKHSVWNMVMLCVFGVLLIGAWGIFVYGGMGKS